MLEHFGFDNSTERIYRVLLSRPDVDVDVALIAKMAELTEEQTCRALGRLAERTLIRWDPDSREAPHLMDPDAALGALIAHHEAEISARKYDLERSRLAVTELLAERETAGTLKRRPGVERIDDLGRVRDKLDELADICEKEVFSLNPGGPQSPENLERSRSANERTLQRGIVMRAVYLESVRNDLPSMEHVTWLTELGAEVRTCLTLPIRMVVVDRTTALVPIDAQVSGQGALVVTEPGMVAGFVALFATTWKSACELALRDRRPDSNQPSAQELEALRLWAQGATDAAVSRALGVSERTVRRMSDALATRLRARSRFEVGARAVKVGWLTTEDLV